MPRLSCGPHSEKSSRGERRPFSPTDAVIWIIWSGQWNWVRESEHSWKFWKNIEIRAAIRPGWLPFTSTAHHKFARLDFIPLWAISVQRSIEETAVQNVVDPRRKNRPTVMITLSVVRDQSHLTIRDRKGIGNLCVIRQRNRLHIEPVQEPDNSSKYHTTCVLYGPDRAADQWIRWWTVNMCEGNTKISRKIPTVSRRMWTWIRRVVSRKWHSRAVSSPCIGCPGLGVAQPDPSN
jgi:hypothetical protein